MREKLLIAAQRLREHLKGIELQVLLLFVTLGGGVWVFLEVADEVVEGDTQSIDETILLAMRSSGNLSDPLGPLWLEEMARDITALGGIAVLSFLGLATLVYFLLIRRRRIAYFMLGSVVGGALLTFLFKTGFDRPRPTLVPHESHAYSASFPSGHSMMSAVVYLTLGALLARVHAQRVLKAYFLSLAIFLTCAVGLSRIYVGVHWPTDVLAGWAAGTAWAVFCWGIALWLQHRRLIERSVRGGEATPSATNEASEKKGS